ncbi:c-type cytochrome [Thiolapillus sp.]
MKLYRNMRAATACVVRRLTKGALVAWGLGLSGMAMAEAPAAVLPAYICAGCHGTGGNSNGPAIPTLAGASRDYIIKAMEDYQSDERVSTIMGRIAKGYSKEEIARIADFFSGQAFVPARGQKSNPELAGEGARLHDRYCEECHAKGGSSPENDAGILAGQWTPYLKYTLADMLAGRSRMPQKMKKKLGTLYRKVGDAAVDQLLNYYAGSKPRGSGR